MHFSRVRWDGGCLVGHAEFTEAGVNTSLVDRICSHAEWRDAWIIFQFSSVYGYRYFILLVQRPCQRHSAEPQITALPFQKLERPEAQSLGAQYILILL